MTAEEFDQLTEQYRAASVANDEKWSSTYNRLQRLWRDEWTG